MTRKNRIILSAGAGLFTLSAVAALIFSSAPVDAVAATTTGKTKVVAASQSNNFSASTTSSDAVPAPASVSKAIRETFGKRFPQIPLKEISMTEMAGVYEVRVNNEVVYTDATGDYLLQGKLLRTVDKVDLTQTRLNVLNAVDFASLPLEDAIVQTKGDGSRKLVIFADPNCGYCKRMEGELAQMDNITVYTFLFPLLGADSEVKTRNIWCAADRAQAWEDWMLRGKAAPDAPKDCSLAPLKRTAELAGRVGVTGTPLLLFTNGARAPGMMEAQQLNKLFMDMAAAAVPKG